MVNATDPGLLTEAEMAGRRQALEYARFLVDKVPGYERARLVALGSQIGVRETRRVYGDVRLTADDVLSARQFDDQIGLCGAPIEDHHEGTGTTWRYLPDGEVVGIPFRALLARDASNVLVAGRCFSATHDAHAAVRSMAQCMAMGQAAGTAAALAARGRADPRDLPFGRLGRPGGRRRHPHPRDGGVVSVVRTVLGDVLGDRLGVCYAHEHLVIDGGVPKLVNPEISLQSVDDAVDELRPCVAAGLGAVVDAMPADAGRNVVKLAAISRRAGVHVVAATGLHHARFYGERHWGELLAPEELAELFVGELTEGIDANDLNGPVVRRTRHRAGVVKVAGSLDGPSARDRRIFEAAAIATARVGAPLLTHCEGGTGGVAQLRLLEELGVPPDRVILSHTDKVVDRGYHRELLSSGAYVVYDQGIRTRRRPPAWSAGWSPTATGTGSCSAPTAPGGRCGRCSAAPRAWPPSAPTWASGWPTSSARRPWTASGSPTRPPPSGLRPCPGRLEGKVCVVTGATGMAADAARRFAREGAEVWVVARDRDQCEALGLPALADLRDEGETEAAFAALRRAHPGSTPSTPWPGPAGGRSATGRPTSSPWRPGRAPSRSTRPRRSWPPGRRCGPCSTSRRALGHPRLAGADVERPGRPPDGAAVRHPRLRGRQGGHDRAGQGDGRLLRRARHPGQRAGPVAGAHADERPGGRRPGQRGRRRAPPAADPRVP